MRLYDCFQWLIAAMMVIAIFLIFLNVLDWGILLYVIAVMLYGML